MIPQLCREDACLLQEEGCLSCTVVDGPMELCITRLRHAHIHRLLYGQIATAKRQPTASMLVAATQEYPPWSDKQGMPLTAFAALFRAWRRGQAPRPRSGAPQAPGLMPPPRPETNCTSRFARTPSPPRATLNRPHVNVGQRGDIFMLGQHNDIYACRR
jgi:hypothetical protein